MPEVTKERKKEIYKNMSEWERNLLLEYMFNKYKVDIVDNRTGEIDDLPRKVVVQVRSRTGVLVYQSIVSD